MKIQYGYQPTGESVAEFEAFSRKWLEDWKAGAGERQREHNRRLDAEIEAKAAAQDAYARLGAEIDAVAGEDGVDVLLEALDREFDAGHLSRRQGRELTRRLCGKAVAVGVWTAADLDEVKAAWADEPTAADRLVDAYAAATGGPADADEAADAAYDAAIAAGADSATALRLSARAGLEFKSRALTGIPVRPLRSKKGWPIRG